MQMHPKSKKKHRNLAISMLFYGRSVGIRTRGLLDPNDAQCIAARCRGNAVSICDYILGYLTVLGAAYSPISFTLR